MNKQSILPLIMLILAIIGIVTAITKPEIREYLGLDDKDQTFIEEVKARKLWVKDNTLISYLDEIGPCKPIDGCDCCGGELALDNKGNAITAFQCAGNPTTYFAGVYEVIDEGIICYFKSKSVTTEWVEKYKPYKVEVKKAEAFTFVVHNNDCDDTEYFAYRIKSNNNFNYLGGIEKGSAYLDFINRLSKEKAYLKLLNL